MNWYKNIIEKQSDSDEDLLKGFEFEDRWIPVNSSFINSVSYTDSLELMEVKMRNGNIYTYWDIPKQIFDDFLNAKSKGAFFNELRKHYKEGKK